MTLRPNWDSYGARTVRPECVARALVFLSSAMKDTTPPPCVTPCADGGIVLEWHRCGLDVEVRVLPAESTCVYWHELESDAEGEYRVGGQDDRTTSLIEALSTGA
jgi:hypothetical protein